MEYLSTLEASAKWGVSPRQVQRLLSRNRIPQAKKYGRSWMIPEDAKKPGDLRRGNMPPVKTLAADLADLLAATSLPLPAENPDAILTSVKEQRSRLQYEGELAYLRGDFQRTMRCYLQAEGDEAARLLACPVAIAASISLGDYTAYTEIEAYLKRCLKAEQGSSVSAFAELALATVAVSIIAPNMAPCWLKEGDFSALAPQTRQNALYLRAKYFCCIGRYESMLAVAETALAFRDSEQGILPHDIYLHLMCAVACSYLDRREEAKSWLLDAMRLALPHGFITPFAEHVTAFGGLMEQCLEQEFPACLDAVIAQWKRTWKNWITFHNQFTKDNITLMLTLREYHLALQVARRIPYARIASEHHISVGRLKNIMLEIYEKLCISGRDELAKYIF